MATNCVRWALYDSPADDYEDLAVLVAFADYASQAGEVTVATATIARRLGMPLADTHAAVRRLRNSGLVQVGERGHVAHLNLRARRRRTA